MALLDLLASRFVKAVRAAANGILGLYYTSTPSRLAHSQNLRHSVWRAAAQSAKLTVISESRRYSCLSGRAGSLRVRFDWDPEMGELGTRITVTHLGRGKGLTIYRNQPGAAAACPGFDPDHIVEMGHPYFDAHVVVAGQASLVLAILDAETRWKVAELMQGRLQAEGREPIAARASLCDGRLEVRIPHSAFAAGAPMADQLTLFLCQILAIAHSLAAPDDLPGRIAHNLPSEPEKGVRLRAVRLLARELAEDPATRKALLAACEDPADEVRFEAAQALDDEGRETLLDLITGEATDDTLAVRAVAALGERLPAEQAAAALGRALEWGRDETARACLEVLGRSGRSEAEGLLLRALQSAAPQVGVAAARALGRVGTAAAVAPLHEAAAGRSGDVRRAARQAIAEIQARLAGAEPGQLSLAAGEAGALSIAQEPGRLSLAGAEPGRLSLPDPPR